MKNLIKKETIKINFKTLFWFLLIFLIYYIPVFLIKPTSKFYLSLKHPAIPVWVFTLGWLLSTISIAFFTTIYICKFRAKEDKENIEGYRRLFLYIFLHYLFTIVLLTTFLKAENLFLTYVLCIAVFVINLFILMETFMLNKKDTYFLLFPLLWNLFLSIISIILYLNN